MKTLFWDGQFTPTEHSTSADKAKFGNALVAFIESDFDKKKFTKVFYRRLSMTFGHIAHYNIHGFWSEWFETLPDRVKFLVNLTEWGCYGTPEYTFCDVERAVQEWLRSSPILERAQRAAIEEAANRDRAVYARA